jgi:hypothetical protein
MNEVFLDDLRDKTHRGMVGQVLSGYHGGGRAYGYRLVPEFDPTKKDAYGRPEHVGTKLAIDEAQVAIVRRIFREYADGLSPVKIVEGLNQEGVPPPGVAFRRKSNLKPTWCCTALYGDPRYGLGLLNNPLYKGEVIWNRTRWEKDPETGRKRRFLRDEREWIRQKAEHLRIVDDALWARVKARQQTIHRASAAIRSALHANARTGRRPKYLFSGLLVCGRCGRKFVIVDPTRYGCSGWRYRGESVCDNTIMASRQVVESVLLEAIQFDLFSEQGFAIVQQEIVRVLAERRRGRSSELVTANARLREAEQKIDNIKEAILQGIVTKTTKAMLEEAEAERDRLSQSVRAGRTKADSVVDFLPNAVEKFKAKLENIGQLRQHEVDKARELLRDVLGSSIILHPTADGVDRFLTAEVSGDYEALTRLILGQNKFGGGHPLLPSLTDPIPAVIQGVALIA